MHYATAPEIARLFGWSPGYVRKLASVHRWRARGHAPREYHLTDVGAYCQAITPRRRQLLP